MKNLWMLLALALFSGHALQKRTMGNGSGWCQPTNGTRIIFLLVLINHYRYGWGTRREPSLYTGQLAENIRLNATAITVDYRYNYHRDHRRSDAERHKADATIIYVSLCPRGRQTGNWHRSVCSRKLNQNIPVPFSSISNEDSSAGGCGDAEMVMTAGTKAR